MSQLENLIDGGSGSDNFFSRPSLKQFQTYDDTLPTANAAVSLERAKVGLTNNMWI
jgi:hypothetical protein